MIEIIKLILESGWRTNLSFLLNFFIVSMLSTLLLSMIFGAIAQTITECIKQYFVMKTSAEMSKLNAIKENESK